MHVSLRWLIAGAIAPVWVLTAQARGDDAYVDVIDPAVQHQRIEYFAASDCWSMQKVGEWSPQAREKLADLLFSRTKGIGLSGWRFNLMGGVERTRIENPWRTGDCFEVSQGKYDWTRCAGQRWFLSAAKQRGTTAFIAFCNTPPKRMTVNGLTSVDPKSPGLTSNLKPEMVPQYATYLADILQHFRDNPDPTERIDFQWVSPVNEPQSAWTGGQEGTCNSNGDIIIQYRAIARELAERKLPTHILGPESGNIADMIQLSPLAWVSHGSLFGNYVRTFCGNALLGDAMDHCLAYHDYWSDRHSVLVSSRQSLHQAVALHPGWRVAMTEYCVMEGGRDLSIKTAIKAARMIQADLSVADASSWSWWTAVSNVDFKDGLIYTDYKKPGDAESIYPSKLLWAFGNFSRFVLPGMIRVDLQAKATAHDFDGVSGSAYTDPVSRQIVVVYINAKSSPETIHLQVAGKQINKWTAFVTTDRVGDDLHEQSADSTIILPAESVVTLVSDK